MNQRAALERYNYYGDSRVRNSMRTEAFTIVAAGPHTCIIKPHDYLVNDEDGDPDFVPLEAAYEVPTKLEVCPSCRGSGVMVNPSIDCGGLTQEDFDEDPDFAEDYFSGAYNQTCSRCKGEKVVPDESAAFDALPPEVRKALRDFQRECDSDLDMRLSELRRGC